MRSGRKVAPNLAAAEASIRQAAEAGSQLVVTPENTALMELERKRVLANTHGEEGNPALDLFAGLSKELGLWLHIGATPIKLAAGKIANRSLLFSPEGSITARYDKIHMFDVDLPGGESYRESKNYSAGNEAVTADLPWGGYGLTICYDLRFPALYRSLAKAGAQFIAVPSAFTKQTGEAHWRVLLRARAIETGCFIFAPAQGGRHEIGRDTYGHSMIVSPWGEVIAEAGDAPAVILADIDTAQVVEARARVPSLQHDRAFEVVQAESLEKEAAAK
jgi:predicted amidohydrolase